MALTPRLDLRQSQQLVMTPQLQQAIKLLQLSNLELADYVSTEVERNPLLEIGEPGDSGGPDEGSNQGDSDFSDSNLRDGGEARDGSDGIVAADKSMDSDFDTSSSSDGALDANYETNIYNNDAVSDRVPQEGGGASSGSLSYEGGGAIKGGGGFSDERSLDQTLEGEENLHDFLMRQMSVLLQEPADRLIATHLIDLVDEAGYVNVDDVQEVGEQLGATPEDLERVLMALQTLEPSGCFARSLSECLAIQLKELDRYDPAMQALVENLELLAKRDMATLKRLCGIDQNDLADMIKEIRLLNPKPGLAYGGQAVQPVVPDIFVQKSRAGTWVVELNTDTLPKVLVNQQYLTELGDVSGGKEAKAFVSDCLSNANWLVKALDQRARTILKVATALVKTQSQFFEHGVRFLKPLTLKDIADEIEMHESTVSRVTNNKFMSCPRGMFELKYFFTSAISAGDGGDAHSSESVKFRLKELIDDEDPKKILSDDKLVIMMKAEGIDIARRTVAKYREAMKIPSSVQRRRLKNMGS
ncbi:RNA polymerase factor sigma-54 [Kordiimonas lacus]|uniref:RNA polymerase sigma-54 factor n=1 Tax=Kordiimonas lacus TaxID=637679 RepID=A0A1G6TU44_9PROT|nr:RNA polymerase factor sigma-54 [Kordiimonas lacus]SDD32559.1 RNA polymerase, sigma 54 subunit, RpoN/SigL [Kordiimonas lacus]